MDTHIAVIGLGRMGLPFAKNLSAEGFAVTGFDMSQAARKVFAPHGKTAETLVDAAHDAQVLITMLPDGTAVRAVIEAVWDHIAPETLVIDMSSSAPMGTRALGAELAAKGISFIDAPVSGGVAKAETGDVAIMAGGEVSDIDRAMPILKAIGSTVFRTGALGSGHATKALNNYVSAAGLQAACEALIVAQQMGIDGDTFVDVLNASTGRNNSTENKLKPFVLSETFASGFALDLMAKDIRTAQDLALELGVDAPQLNDAAIRWAYAADTVPDGDHTQIYQALKAARIRSDQNDHHS